MCAAVCVENLDVALAVGEDDKAGAECLDLVGLTVAIGIAQSEAVPSTCEPCGRRCRFDFSNFLGRRPVCVGVSVVVSGPVPSAMSSSEPRLATLQ